MLRDDTDTDADTDAEKAFGREKILKEDFHPLGGREILDLVKCRAGGKFSLAGATTYFGHERL